MVSVSRRARPPHFGHVALTNPGASARLVSTSAVAGKKYEDYLKEPVTYENMRRGSYDPAPVD